MTYRIVLTSAARREMYEDAIWWAEHRDSLQADRWLAGLERALATLGENPEQHSRAVESERYSIDLRQMLYGLSKRPTHRAVFQICGDEVVIYGIRHLARNDLTIEDLEQ